MPTCTICFWLGGAIDATHMARDGHGKVFYLCKTHAVTQAHRLTAVYALTSTDLSDIERGLNPLRKDVTR